MIVRRPGKLLHAVKARGGSHGKRFLELKAAFKRGDIPRERLTLAAYLGDEDAALVVNHTVGKSWFDLVSCVQGLEPWGPVVAVQAAHYAAVYVERLYAQRQSLLQEFQTSFATALQAVHSWLPFYNHPRARDMLNAYRAGYFDTTSIPLKGKDGEDCYQITLMVISVLNACDCIHEPKPPREAHPAIAFSCAAIGYAQKTIQEKTLPPDFGSLDGFVNTSMIAWALSLPRHS